MIRRIFLMLVPVAIMIAADKPDFSGHWVVDLAKSDFGMMPPPEKMERHIEHKDPEMKIKSYQKSERGEMNAESSYSTDGKEAKVQMRGREAKVKANWKGTKLNVATKSEFNGMEIGQSEMWSLSEDGKTMTIENTITAPQGEFTTKLVFTKGS
ncbi:MAG: hypothetical protein FJW36_22950 [Acidobacteria bacterium]|nr:hypothetical protein [Acidobacteriota bacterium]